MVDKIKISLRLTHDRLDGEITDLITACKADLRTAGVIRIEDSDPLILLAVTLFCKWTYNHNGQGEKHLMAYESLKTPLRLAGDLFGGDDNV